MLKFLKEIILADLYKNQQILSNEGPSPKIQVGFLTSGLSNLISSVSYLDPWHSLFLNFSHLLQNKINLRESSLIFSNFSSVC